MHRIDWHKVVSRRIAIGAIVVANGVMLASSNIGHAALVSPGGTVAPTPIAGLPPGDTLVVTETKPFTGTNASHTVVFTGTVTSSVYSDPANPDTGQPGLDFVYQLSNDATSLDPIDRLTVASFASFLTDLNYVVGTGAVSPTTGDSSVSPPGKTIGFNFPVGGTVVLPGQTTTMLVVETNAQTIAAGTASVIDGGSGSTQAEAPVAVITITVPEPATFGVLAVVGGFILGRRRR
jgi:hypothetical protein